MNRYRCARTLAVLLCAAALTAGCAPTRSQYYGSLGASRLRAYRRWESQNAQEDRPRLEGQLSLEEGVRLAMQYNPQLLAAVQGRENARGRVMEAWSEALPRVDVAAGYTRLDKVASVDTGMTTLDVGDRDNYSYGVTITQPLFKGGSMSIALRAARLFSYLSDEGVRAALETTIFSVATAYYDSVLARQLVAVYEDALRSAEAHLEAVRFREQQGVATEYDVLRANVEVSNVQAELIDQERLRDIARAALFRSMGVSQRSRVELTTALGTEERDTPSFPEAVQAAFRNRPDIYQAAINTDLYREAVKEARTDYLPNLEAFYWRQWAKPDPHEATRNNWNDQWTYGLSLTWPLFDGFAREGRVVQQKALLRQSEILLVDTEQQALLEIRDAILELHSAEELVRSQRLNRQRAGRAEELVEEGYRVGVNTEIEVLDARAALTRASGLYYGALHRYTTGRIALQRAMGLLTPGPGMSKVPERVTKPGDIRAAALPEGDIDQ